MVVMVTSKVQMTLEDMQDFINLEFSYKFSYSVLARISLAKIITCSSHPQIITYLTSGRAALLISFK